MNALLVVAHGSRSPRANEEVARLAGILADRFGKDFGRVDYAYLEIAEPKIAAAVATLAADGVTRIKVLPFFLAGGTHVAKDIPACIAAAQTEFPTIRFEILPHLGALDGIPELILRHINNMAGTDRG